MTKVTKEQCLKCANLNLEDGGDHFVCEVAALCEAQKKYPSKKIVEPNGYVHWKSDKNLMLDSVLSNEHCEEHIPQ